MRFTYSRASLVIGFVLATSMTFASAQSLGAQEPLTRAANLAAARLVYEALPESDRKALQDALIWSGQYNGVADGTFGRQTFDAIAAFQLSRRKPPTGILDPSDRSALESAAQRARIASGFEIMDDPKTGGRIGIPTKVLTRIDANASGGTRWQSGDEKVTLDTRAAPEGATLEALYQRNLAIQSPGRNVTYKVLRPNFLVIAGETATGKFYTRYDSGDAGIRGFSIGYDKAVAPQVDRFVVAIANSFDPFGGNRTRSAAPAPPPVAAPAGPAPALPRRPVIGTGIGLSPRRVLTTVRPETCRNMKVADFEVGDQKAVPVGEGWSTITLPRDLFPSNLAISPRSATAGEKVLVLAYDDSGQLTVVPGTMGDGSVSAPLQEGAVGAPVVNGNNQLLGLIAGPVVTSVKIAGVMTERRHGMVPAEALTPVIAQSNSGTDAGGAAAVAAYWKPFLLPITCAR